ncbi:hypothetical protein BKA70DRAFT_886288 [Coprinopsis sp. MPI-PUGE-AT-0042]|nr:hypothetical protein BKA70DRAFT_886288 [Coprinopsis sp. MPI-PUGE-AT-0042]
MPWPIRIARQFQIVPENGSESDLCGPYNKLLNHLFPPESEFTVIPRSHIQMTARERPPDTQIGDHPHLGFMFFEVEHDNLPVLLLLMARPSALESPLAREMADAQMRMHLLSRVELCPTKTLRGISAFGTRLCFFTVDIGEGGSTIDPVAILKNTEVGLEDVAPLERWSTDLMSAEGEEQVCKVVESIKEER